MTTQSSSKSSQYWQQTMQSRMLMVVLCMVVFVPLLASPANPAMQAVTAYALRLMAALLAGILVLRARPVTNRQEFVAFLKTSANLPTLLYLLACLVSVLTLPPALRSYGWTEFMRVLTGTLLYFALAYHIRRSEYLVKVLDALAVVAGVMALLGLVKLGTVEIDTYTSLLVNTQLFGAFLVILFPFTLMAALTQKQKNRLALALASAALTGICLLLSGTETVWYAVATEFVTLGLLSFLSRRRPQDSPPPKKFLLPGLLILLCAGVLLALGGVSSLRFAPESSRALGEHRQRMQRSAWEMTKAKPVFGHGLGSYPVLQSQYTQEPGSSPVRVPTLSEMAHSFWLQTAAEQGLVGVALFGAILVLFFLSGIRRLSHMDAGIRRTLLLACLTAVAGFIVDAISNPAWQFAQVSMFFWFALGLGVACLRPRAAR